MARHVAVRLEGLVFDYRFNEGDVAEEFSKFGQVNEAMLLDEELAPDVAIVEFGRAEDAAKAAQALHQSTRNVEGYSATLRVQLMDPNIEHELLVKAHILSTGSNPFSSHDKFVCKYLLRADLMSPEYSVVGRIVGMGGEHVKAIQRATGAHVKVNGKPRSIDDPLHVRVAAESALVLAAGKAAAETLIQEMFSDYRKWCDKNYVLAPTIRVIVVEGAEALRPLGRLVEFFISK